MDPEATWNLLVEAIIARDPDEARSIASDLVMWLDRGGFPPTISLQCVSMDWQTYLCKRLCHSVISAPLDYWK